MLNQKEKLIIIELQKSKVSSIYTLAEKLDVSDRSIRNYISAINGKYDDTLVVKNNYVTLKQNDFLASQRVYDKDFRYLILIILYYMDQVDIKGLENIFFVSNKTLYADLKNIKTIKFTEDVLDWIGRRINQDVVDFLYLHKYVLVSTLNESLLEIVSKINKRYPIPSNNNNLLNKNQYDQYVLDNSSYDNEVIDYCFLYYLYYNDMDIMIKDDLSQLVNDILVEVSYIYLEDFLNNTKLIEQITYHVRRSYIRYKYNFLDTNYELLSTISEYENKIKIINEIISSKFGEYDLYYNAIELTYISIYIVNALKISEDKIKNIIVSCSNGVSSSILLANQIKQMYDFIKVIPIYRFEDAIKKIDDIDYIITVHAKIKHEKIIEVNTILIDEDFEVLNKYLMIRPNKRVDDFMYESLKPLLKNSVTKEDVNYVLRNYQNEKIEKDYIMLKELITKDMITQEVEIKEWEDAIRIAATPMLKYNHIKSEYVQAMIQSVNDNGSYIVITENFAIPHAQLQTAVNQVSMSLLKLEEAVTFPGEKEVRVIIVLATNDNESHLYALQELTTKITKEDFINKIINTKNKEEILEIINQGE